MNTYLLLSKYSDLIVRRCEANTRDEAVEIFDEMGYYQDDYRIQTLEEFCDYLHELPKKNLMKILKIK